jgi:hypothetical protein
MSSDAPRVPSRACSELMKEIQEILGKLMGL